MVVRTAESIARAAEETEREVRSRGCCDACQSHFVRDFELEGRVGLSKLAIGRGPFGSDVEENQGESLREQRSDRFI